MLDVDGTENETLIEGYSEARAAEPASCEPPRLNVLLIEDEPTDSALIERCLNYMATYEPQITVTGTLAAARFAIASDDFDIVLLSDGMCGTLAPDVIVNLGDPLELCPIVLLTGYLRPDNERVAPTHVAPTRVPPTHVPPTWGATSCLAKSDLSPKLLEAGIDQALRRHAEHCTRMFLVAEPQA